MLIHQSAAPGRVLAVVALLGLTPLAAGASGEAPDICGKTTYQLLQACQLEAGDDARVGFAKCLNLSNREAAEDCLEEAAQEQREAQAECKVIRSFRDEVCAEVGKGPYDPKIDPARFISTITHPYAPFKPGAWWEYRKRTPEGVERIRVEVLKKRRKILGVSTTVVRDRVWLDDVLIEDTIDWLAQDVEGNVWYFGEIVQNFEDGLLANLDGSFEAGKNGAKPGLWMKARPKAGDFYRQEWAPQDAEDVVEVESINAPDDVPFKGSGPVLMTRDYTPLSPGAEELKFYVPGIGFVLEIDLETGERLELADYSR